MLRFPGSVWLDTQRDADCSAHDKSSWANFSSDAAAQCRHVAAHYRDAAPHRRDVAAHCSDATAQYRVAATYCSNATAHRIFGANALTNASQSDDIVLQRRGRRIVRCECRAMHAGLQLGWLDDMAVRNRIPMLVRADLEHLRGDS